MDDFDEFWAAFPRRVGKTICRVKFKKLTGTGLSTKVDGETLLLRCSAADLIRAAKAFAMSDETDDKKFIPHPSTWLNQGRFEDYDEETTDELVARYDRMREIKQERKHKLEVVR